MRTEPNILIFSKCKDDKERGYYLRQTIEYGWSRNILTHHIKTDLYGRDRKALKQNNFGQALPSQLSEMANEMMKSEFNMGIPHWEDSLSVCLEKMRS